ncbi:unnamed protein product [Chondrus crispus]|uniref:TPR repeat-containing protein n=1 Tax=Chondrus crispus TaxID=2769 RepID=R7QL42_CHOCR|nr:unnamed protein product [Chondrus crispus]CDF38110.1 unnamed protein product [Chondrus crispus]|eukprot:XP_005717979.1 unnamed protein product [Chondrus crispus]
MSPRLVAAFAFREMHAFPKSGAARRARFVMAAELARVGKDAAAWEAAGLSAMKAGAAPPRPASCTQALVVAAMRLARGENKLAGMAARAGRSMAQEEGSRDRLAVLCGLLVAAAQAGEREFKDAVAEYGKARAYARDVGDAWIENAADQGMVQTCVAAYGRKSRQTSMAIEEAAGAADNCYGLLESTWTDALVGDDVDMETMEALADRAVVEVQGIREEDSELGWHARALGDSFVMPKAMLAAIAKSRHGQMLMAQKQPTLECVKQAQGCQMEAATLHKGLPNPFAHLGWIFEKRHELLHDDRSLLRAMRCYEKAVGMDAAHPLAARSLARLLKDSGNESEAVLVAREAVGRNPKARWAHNLIGWSRIRKIRYNEACISFRNALKGKPQLSSRAREVLYGTTVGQTVGDNDLLIDVDSWRGLSVAYMRQGMFGPAIACLEDALQLAKNPPYFVTVTVGNFGQLRESLALLLESEKSVLMQLDGQSADARNSMESILQDSRAPGTIKRYLSEALVYIAAKDWVSGCYSRATKGRICAAQLLEQTLVDHKQDMPSLNPSSLWKELGDTLVEVGTSHPKFMQELIGAAEISTALSQAEVAYMRALHYSPWEKQKRVQDAIAAMLRSAVVKNDTAYESKAVDLLSQSQLDPSVMALLVLDCAAIQEKESVQRAALEIALRVAKSVVSTKHLIALEASVATVAAQLGDIAVGAWTSVSAVSRDPSNWWGWFAVGVIREADARINGWPLAMIQSSEGAYREADKLGGGPCAVRGLLRCLIKKLEKRKDIDWNAEDSYAEACFCISTAARVGVSEPSACREVIDEFRMSKENEAKAQGQQIAESQIASEAYRHVHLYPFLPTALGVALP